jgi:pimeloyl-ACP methyl ester carboxylesterase
MKLYQTLILFTGLCSISFYLNAQVCPSPQVKTTTKFTKTISDYDPPAPPPKGDPEVFDFEGDRIIFWVHGLAGSSASWSRAAEATAIGGGPNHPDYPAREAVNDLPTYTDFSMNNAAFSVNNAMWDNKGGYMTAGNVLPEHNIAIGHSQGGLVVRNVDRIFPQNDKGPDFEPYRVAPFGGMVTFGTPHQGAQILNNVDFNGPDMARKFAVKTCNDLGAGPLQEKLNTVDLGKLKIFNGIARNALSGVGGQLLQQTCDVLGNGLIPIFFDDFTSGITEDYKVGAPALDALNNFSSDIPKVGFYGVEAEPVMWRNSFYIGVEEPNNFTPFDANNDDALVDQSNAMNMHYLAKFLHWQAEEAYFSKLVRRYCGLNINCSKWRKRRAEARRVRDAYLRGVNWFNTANDEYKKIIGALETQTTSQHYCECVDFTTNETTQTPINDPSDCEPVLNNVQFCYPITETTVELIEKPSDGVVIAESAGNFPGASNNVKLAGSNHQQMRNDKNLKSKLNELFNGRLDQFFKTEAL